MVFHKEWHPSTRQPATRSKHCHKPSPATGRWELLLLFKERANKEQQGISRGQARQELEIHLFQGVHFTEGDSNRNCWLQHRLH